MKMITLISVLSGILISATANGSDVSVDQVIEGLMGFHGSFLKNQTPEQKTQTEILLRSLHQDPDFFKSAVQSRLENAGETGSVLSSDLSEALALRPVLRSKILLSYGSFATDSFGNLRPEAREFLHSVETEIDQNSSGAIGDSFDRVDLIAAWSRSGTSEGIGQATRLASHLVGKESALKAALDQIHEGVSLFEASTKNSGSGAPELNIQSSLDNLFKKIEGRGQVPAFISVGISQIQAAIPKPLHPSPLLAEAPPKQNIDETLADTVPEESGTSEKLVITPRKIFMQARADSELEPTQVSSALGAFEIAAMGVLMILILGMVVRLGRSNGARFFFFPYLFPSR